MQATIRLLYSFSIETLQVFFEIYYAQLPSGDISQWDRSTIGRLLKSTHKNELPYTHSTKEDVWDALIDLDAESLSGTVKLVYRNIDVQLLLTETMELGIGNIFGQKAWELAPRAQI